MTEDTIQRFKLGVKSEDKVRKSRIHYGEVPLSNVNPAFRKHKPNFIKICQHNREREKLPDKTQPGQRLR